MNKAELITHIADDIRITKVQAGGVIDSITGAIISALKKGDTVALSRFGTFSVS